MKRRELIGLLGGAVAWASPAQHWRWAQNARRLNRPDLAQHHEQLARAIEIIDRRRQAEAPTVASPPLGPAL